ncbi:hypothetical protein [Pseudomonas hormoni]
MKKLETLFARIEKITAPIQQINKYLNIAIPPHLQRHNQAIQSATRHISTRYQPLFEQINNTLAKVIEAAQLWQQARKEDVIVMADNGWYPNWLTFFYTPEKETSSIDELMSMHLNENWDDITQKILELCQNRKHILEVAFDLHKSGNYIASIPLFLAQADGICCESLKSFLFAGNQTEEKIKELLDNGQIETSILTNILLEPFKLKNHHNAGISKHSHQAKSKAPNRNGILHGHRRHMDYGTETNSLKCFSLLSFIAYSTKEIISTTEPNYQLHPLDRE